MSTFWPNYKSILYNDRRRSTEKEWIIISFSLTGLVDSEPSVLLAVVGYSCIHNLFECCMS